jgi:hypothetical protein
VTDQLDCRTRPGDDLCTGKVMLTAGTRDSMIDYVSALPLSAL